MSEIRDFKCSYDNAVGICEEVTKELFLTFPDAYQYSEKMAAIALAQRQHEGTAFCKLPFCHTVEAEALGGNVNYGNEKYGPRAGEYRYKSLEELLDLPEMNLEKGRIHEVLLACKILRKQGEPVVLEVCGPFTILSVMIDSQHVFRAMRKKPELVWQIFSKLEEELLKYIRRARTVGVDMISYADSSGGVDMIGPKYAKQVVEKFTYDFLRRAEKEFDDSSLMILCPKTALALIGAGRAKFEDVKLPCRMSYGEACIEMRGKVRFVGQQCIRNVNYYLEDGVLKEIRLLEGMDEL